MADVRFRETSSLCTTCKATVPATVWLSDGAVVLRKRCPEHGDQSVQVCSDADWYVRTSARPTVPSGRTLLPIVPITSACDRACPICYTHNRNVNPYLMQEDELRQVLRHATASDPERRMVNITGGEPTLHPRFLRLLEICGEEGYQRVTVSTHGLGLARRPDVLQRLAELRARVILSFDSLRPAPNETLLGSGGLLAAKLEALDALGRQGIDTTLLAVVAKGVNDGELGEIVRLALDAPFVRSIEFHTLTFTGRGGRTFPRESRLDAREALRALESAMDGVLRADDFVPHPSAHPLCYQVSYLLGLDDGRWIPFTRFLEPDALRDMLAGTLYLEPGLRAESILEDAIQRVWAGDSACEEPGAVLQTLRGLSDRLFAAGLGERERLAEAERRTKAVYLHAHMDEETFDAERLRDCPVRIVDADGTERPSCRYNVLDRERDPRFRASPDVP